MNEDWGMVWGNERLIFSYGNIAGEELKAFNGMTFFVRSLRRDMVKEVEVFALNNTRFIDSKAIVYIISSSIINNTY